jgi:putative membrane protein
MNNGPEDQQRFIYPSGFEQHHGGHGWFWLIPFVFLLLFAATFFWVVLQTRGGRFGVRPAPPAAPAADGALEELRLRYARGEVSREEFLAADADLRGLPAAPSG